MAQPNIPGGSLKSTLSGMSVGDYISCEYTTPTANTAGTFANLGSATKSDISTAGTTTPSGTFYFIKTAQGTLVADRVVQTGVSWDTLNAAFFIQTNPMGFEGGLDPSTGTGTISYQPTTNSVSSISAARRVNFQQSSGKWYFELTMGGTSPYVDIGNTSMSFVSGRSTSGNQYGFSSTAPGGLGTGTYSQGAFAATDIAGFALDLDNRNIYLYKNNVLTWSSAISSVIPSTVWIGLGCSSSSSTGIIRLYTQSTTLTYSPPSGYSPITPTWVNTYAPTLRSLSGGSAFLNESGERSVINRNLGAFPAHNEFDQYIVKSTLGGKITAGSNNVWNWYNGSAATSCWTTNTPNLSLNGGVASSARLIRGYDITSTFAGAGYLTYALSTIIPTGKKTLYFEVNVSGTKSSPQVIISSRNMGVATSSGFSCYISANTGYVVCDYLTEGGTTNYTVTSTVQINDGAWHAIKFTYDGTTNANGVKLYVDDLTTPNATATCSGTEPATTLTSTTIGRNSATNNYLTGQIDRLYVLSADDSFRFHVTFEAKNGNDLISGTAPTSAGVTYVDRLLLPSLYNVTSNVTTSGLTGFRPVLKYSE